MTTSRNTADVEARVTANEASLSLASNYGKTLIINGDFSIWQRGTSQTASGYGSADRIKSFFGGSTMSITQQAFTLGQTDVPGNPKYFFRNTVTSSAGAGNFVTSGQYIEDVTKTSGRQITLSFYAKADAAKNIATEFSQNFGTGGSPSAAVVSLGVTTHSLTTSWQRFTTTVTLPSVSGKTLGTNNNDFLATTFWFDAGSSLDARTNSLGQQSGTFDIANVQLEFGDTATEFEYVSPADQLARCQRYYFSPRYISDQLFTVFGDGYAFSTTSIRTVYQLPTPMRALPAISQVGTIHTIGHATADVNTLSIQTTQSSTNYISANMSAVSGAPFTTNAYIQVRSNNSATANITFDAEL